MYYFIMFVMKSNETLTSRITNHELVEPFAVSQAGVVSEIVEATPRRPLSLLPFLNSELSVTISSSSSSLWSCIFFLRKKQNEMKMNPWAQRGCIEFLLIKDLSYGKRWKWPRKRSRYYQGKIKRFLFLGIQSSIYNFTVFSKCW